MSDIESNHFHVLVTPLKDKLWIHCKLYREITVEIRTPIKLYTLQVLICHTDYNVEAEMLQETTIDICSMYSTVFGAKLKCKQ